MEFQVRALKPHLLHAFLPLKVLPPCLVSKSQMCFGATHWLIGGIQLSALFSPKISSLYFVIDCVKKQKQKPCIYKILFFL